MQPGIRERAPAKAQERVHRRVPGLDRRRKGGRCRSYGPLTISAAEAAWARWLAKGVPNDIVKAAYRKLMQIHNARTLDDLRAPPGDRLEALTGNWRGQHSIRINDQWRVCFRRRDADAYGVETVDYH
ncbi:MAG: type II toxin-antitoxin system RelE/ParE family toxin [Parvibaculum sp.]